MKKSFVTLSAATLLTMSMSPMAFAQTSSTYTFSQSHIIVNGQTVSNPDKFASGGTTFVPIWYVMQVMTKLGYQTTWDYGTRTWNVATSGQVPSLSINAGGGQTTISVNGTTVESNVPTIAAIDPTSDGNMTRYMPIWYVQQLLNAMGMTTDTWDGTTWTMVGTPQTISSPPASGSSDATMATKLEAAVDFYNFDVNVAQKDTPSNYSGEYTIPNATTDPYSDVPQSDWAAVHYDLYHGLITADSSTLFGSSDPVTADTMDAEFMWSMGIPKNSPVELAWNPGDGNAVAWANAYFLNQNVPTTGDLTQSELQQQEQNFVTAEQGWYQTSDGVYHLAFAPYNQFMYGSTPNTTAGAATDVSLYEQSMQYTSEITFQKIGGSGSDPSLLWKVPGFSIDNTFSVMLSDGNNPVMVSMNDGQSYTAFNHLDNGYSSSYAPNGGITNPPSTVYLKDDGTSNSLTVDANNANGYGSSISFTASGTPIVQQDY
ncbi:MAG: stalk domain-containing protein [Acidibacillus sp.]|nr:stalk domain-containing protein [Acidibacillus sp.]